MGWRTSDTVLMVWVGIISLLTGATALHYYDEHPWGNASVVEIDWTVWAAVGLIVSLYKLSLLWGDQMSLRERHRGWREWLGGLWTLSNCIGFSIVLLLFLISGLIVGQTPPNPRQVIEGFPPSFFVGGLVMLAERVLICVMVFGLICRRRLAE